MKEPYFPQPHRGYGGGDFHPGVSLRARLMAMSMQGQRASGKLDLTIETSDQVAEVAEADADALIRRMNL